MQRPRAKEGGREEEEKDPEIFVGVADSLHDRLNRVAGHNGGSNMPTLNGSMAESSAASAGIALAAVVAGKGLLNDMGLSMTE